MRQNSYRGERTRHGRVPDAGDLGWDDSLYESQVPRQRTGSKHPSGTDQPEQADRAPGSADGHHDDGRHDDGRPARPTRRKRRWLRWFGLCLAVLILGTAGAGYLVYQDLNNNLAKDELNLGDNKLDRSQPNAAGQTPLNILLLGSDSRNSEENLKLGGSKGDVGRKPLADVQMLLHVSADRSNMSVISIPRDTRVTIPKCTDPDDGQVYAQTESLTINKSLQHGGPGCTVAAWEELTGIPIDHFMMIDFAGVVSMADAVGGVPVCVDSNIHDPLSGLRLPQGTSVVRGEQALQWLRTRHGFEDGSDIGRAKAQHMYMAAMVRKLKAGTKLSDPDKLFSLANAATAALTVDDGIGSVKKLYDLANDLKRVPTERITMVTMPWVPDPWNPRAHVVPKQEDAEQVFAMVRSDTALDGKEAENGGEPSGDPSPTESPIAEDEIPVVVQNGTQTVALAPVSGRAGEITEQLVSLGFTQATTDSALRSQADTTVLYRGREQRAAALAVAEALDIPEGAVKASAEAEQVTLIVGADWRAGSSYPRADSATDEEEPTEAPQSADALQGDEQGCMHVNPNYTW